MTPHSGEASALNHTPGIRNFVNSIPSQGIKHSESAVVVSTDLENLANLNPHSGDMNILGRTPGTRDLKEIHFKTMNEALQVRSRGIHGS